MPHSPQHSDGMAEGCSFRSRPFSELTDAGAVWYADAAADAAGGWMRMAVDLVPERNAHFGLLADSYAPIDQARQRLLVPGGTMLVDECTVGSTDTNSSWHVQRVGPFASTGGSDWWLLYWHDVASLASLLPVAVIGWKISPVDAYGRHIGQAAIHEHHIGLNPTSISTPLHTASRIRCVLGSACTGTWPFIIQADFDSWQRYYENCLHVNEPIQLGGTYNDVRPADSSPLVWHLQVRLRVASSCTPASSALSIVHGGSGNAAQRAVGSSTIAVNVPFREDSFYYHASRMPFGGRLMASAEFSRHHLPHGWHVHPQRFQAGFMFAASPAALGLPAIQRRCVALSIDCALGTTREVRVRPGCVRRPTDVRVAGGVCLA